MKYKYMKVHKTVADVIDAIATIPWKIKFKYPKGTKKATKNVIQQVFEKIRPEFEKHLSEEIARIHGAKK